MKCFVLDNFVPLCMYSASSEGRKIKFICQAQNKPKINYFIGHRQ